MMENDFDNTSHPTHQILDPIEIEMTVALVPLKLLDFLCVYPLAHTQDSFKKTEMNYNLMVQNYIPLILILFRALNFHMDFESQGKLVTVILGLE
jgi:hypothetical protein